MGQRTDRFAAVPRSKHTANSLLRYSAFTTPLGWMAFAGRDEAVFRLVIGHATEAAARSQIEQMMAADGEEACPDSNWLPSVRRLLEQFSLGVAVDFSDVTVQMPAHLTEFQRRVLEETRKIAFGDTVTYAELAARAGRPGAARAVGNVMAMNRVPIIIPCHRVVAAGKLGGYSAPRGVELKKQILRLEADGIEPVPALALN